MRVCLLSQRIKGKIWHMPVENSTKLKLACNTTLKGMSPCEGKTHLRVNLPHKFLLHSYLWSCFFPWKCMFLNWEKTLTILLNQAAASSIIGMHSPLSTHCTMYCQHHLSSCWLLLISLWVSKQSWDKTQCLRNWRKNTTKQSTKTNKQKPTPKKNQPSLSRSSEDWPSQYSYVKKQIHSSSAIMVNPYCHNSILIKGLSAN